MRTTIVVFLLAALTSRAQYSVSWVGNTYGDEPHHVGNAARSMWVSPGGIVYTASIWDENRRNIGVYRDGAVIGAMGGTKESQGSAIGGDSTWIFTAQQAPNAGKIGRYNRSTGVRDLLFTATTGTGDAIHGITVYKENLYVCDSTGVSVFTTGGSLLRRWKTPATGAIAADSNGHIWVAGFATATLYEYDTAGTPLVTFRLDPGCRPSALYADNSHGQLWVGDQGPEMNIKIYGQLSSRPSLVRTFGVKRGYLDTTQGIRGQTGDKRFTRITGIGSDERGRVYVLNNPWGGSWDAGRNAATDIHCYDSSGRLLWTLQALNFEGNAAAAADSQGTELYSGNILYRFTGAGGAGYLANTIDPFRYPRDARVQSNDKSRGQHFGLLASVDGHRILVTSAQNADVLYTFYFNPATDGYIAIPCDTIPSPVRNGFQLDPAGNLWVGRNDAIYYYPLKGFAANGRPHWTESVVTPAPSSISPLNRIGYLPGSDRMMLAGGSRDWTLIGSRIEVYDGWLAGNRTPNTVITLHRAQAKSMAVAGDYVFIGYYATPVIDIFHLGTGALVQSLNAGDGVYAGNDVDSEYGLQAFQLPTGNYLITKDDYNASKIVVYTWKKE